MTELRSGQYQPSPVKRVEIDKPDGGKRQLGIPTIVDRVIQQAIAQVLTPIFDPTFLFYSRVKNHNSVFIYSNKNQKNEINVHANGDRAHAQPSLCEAFDRTL